MHPSLKTYIACFLSPPFPKVYPRGGGPWDQDPILMRDFRIIRRFEIEWKEAQEHIESSKHRQPGMGAPSPGVGGLDDALNSYIAEIESNEY